MGLVSKPYTFSAGAVIVAAQHNSCFDTLYNLVNGSLDTDNLSASAAIVDTQLAAITTASKVNTSALTTTSQAAGDVLYNDGTNWVRLPKDAGKYLKSGASAVSWETGFVAATQSDQETGTSTTAAVVPGVQQFHPSAAKAWCYFNGATAGTNAPTAGYGVTSVTKNGTGDYTINWATNFSSANYCVIGSAQQTGGTTYGCFVSLYHTSALAAGTARINVHKYDNNTADVYVCVMAFGDQ